MMKKTPLLATLLSFAFAVFAGDALAAKQCRDASGKFIKCPPAAEKCRDVKTKKFAKCGTPGTEPVPATKEKQKE